MEQENRLRIHSSKLGIPLPSCPHKVLSHEEIGDSEVLIIGDVHGCLHELRQLITTAVTMTSNNCVFVFCGDIVSKGPFSVEALQYVRSLGDQAYVVRGNHENRALEYYYSFQSGLQIPEKLSWIKELSDSDIHYLNELPYSIRIPHLNVTVVHAGLDPWKALHCQDAETMTTVETISVLDDMSSEKDTSVGVPWASLWQGPEHVFFGHDARSGLQLYPYATGLDTGCVYGGCLTAKFITGSRQFLKIPAQKTYRQMRTN